MITQTKTDLLLGIESSGLTSTISISEKDQILGKITLNIKNIHSRKMTIMVQQLMENLSVSLSEFRSILLSAGPGSFTGLRIGYSLAKGFAHSLQLPVAQVSTLDIWAYQQGFTVLPVIAVINAHRNELFIGQYLWEMENLNKIADYQLVPLAKLSELISSETLFVGGDLQTVGVEIKKRLPQYALMPFPLQVEPDASALHTLGYQKFVRGEFSNAEDCEPLYMRDFKGVM